MITIQKSRTNLPEVDYNLIKLAVRKTLSKYSMAKADITIQLTGDDEITQFNQEYRGISEATDVLSFEQHFLDPDTGRLYLGDIVISLERVINQALNNKITTDEECAFLAIHGTLHLLGYDHYTPEEKSIMWEIQDKIYLETIQDFQEKTI